MKTYSLRHSSSFSGCHRTVSNDNNSRENSCECSVRSAHSCFLLMLASVDAIFGNASRNIRQASKPLNNAINTDQSRIDMRTSWLQGIFDVLLMRTVVASISRNATTGALYTTTVMWFPDAHSPSLYVQCRSQ